MAKSLLFITDISGFTHFVQTTEVEHSQHVIAELLEVLISANTQDLALAEIEGDALFFYKKEQIPSQEKLLAQVESMYTAFYSHLKLMEKHRICPCNACATAPQLQLKIVGHCGNLQFLEVQGNKKPFGEPVIQTHRLLKNSVVTNNYVLLSEALADEVGMSLDYESQLFNFQPGVDSYDGKEIKYISAEIDPGLLKLKIVPEGRRLHFDREPQLVFKKIFSNNAEILLEYITNYKYRHLWVTGADKIEWNSKEVTRVGSEHSCIVNGKHLNFTTVTKDVGKDELVYGEMTTSPPPVDALYQFFILKPISDTETEVLTEVYWEAKSILKKILIALFVKKALKKGIENSLDKLYEIVNSVS